MPIAIEKLKQWYEAHREEILRDFFHFLQIPSISADPQYSKQTNACADWVAFYLKKMGLNVELWKTDGFPVVFGTLTQAGPSRPTLMIYHHYDVQPVDPIDLWQSDPFQPEVRHHQVYARGALDNKGQCFYSLTALRAILELSKSLNLNLKVFIEGEEESGSHGTSQAIKEHRHQLSADHLLVVDFDLPAPNTPGITVGMRGLVSFEVECKNGFIDLHSGTHGGIALNPNRALASVLAKLWDEKGSVTIPHFYDHIDPLSPKDLAALDMGFDIDCYTKSFGVRAFCAEEGVSIKESNWLRPTLEINGMWGGYTGQGFKTVIPHQAHAKISCRLVPGQDPDRITHEMERTLHKLAPQGIEMKVTYLHGYPAFRSSFDSPIIQAAALSYEEVFEKPCRTLFCGASVPIIVELSQATGAQVAMIGMGLADDQIHAPNEHFGLDRFEKGFLTMSRLIGHLEEK